MIVPQKHLFEDKKTHAHTNTKAKIMIYMGPVWAKMQSWPVRSLSLWTIQMSGSVEIENMETLLARAKTSLPTKPRDIKNEVSGWMASGISRFLPQENKRNQLGLWRFAQTKPLLIDHENVGLHQNQHKIRNEGWFICIGHIKISTIRQLAPPVWEL